MEFVTNKHKVYLSTFYWNKMSDDFTCEILFRGKILCIGLSFLINDSNVYNRMPNESKKKLLRLKKAKDKFKFVI